MTPSFALGLVESWHTALNSGEVDSMLRLCHPDVQIGGPRSTTSGIEVMRDWFGRANVRFIPLQGFARENTVVVEQRGEWLNESGALSSTAVVATVFTIAEDRIASVIRYEDLAAALGAASLSLADQVTLE